MTELPRSWVSAVLSEISIIEMGQSPDSRSYNDQGKGLPFFQGKAEFGKLYPTVQKWSTEPTKIANAGDILLSVRAPVGPTNLAFEECCIGRGLAAIRAETSINQKYLFHHFRNIESWLTQQGTGTTFAAVSGELIRNLNVPLAPLNEQKRIADKLDSLLAQVDACQTHLDCIPQIIKQFRQAVLAAAISGELTMGWNGTKNIYHWDYERAQDVCDKVQSGGTPREGFAEKAGIPFLKVYNIVEQKIDFHYRPQYITEKTHKGASTKSQVKSGDVLMNIVGPPLGKVAIVPDEFLEWNINQAITLFRPSSRLISKWIYYFLCSGHSIAEIIHQTRGSAGQINISLSQCRDFLFPIPPLDEQYEIVRRVEVLFAFADELEMRTKSTQKYIKQLLPSILTKAFRGELVAQDENDEDAAILLERIRLARANAPKEAKKPRRRPEMSDIKKEKISIVQAVQKAGKAISTEQLFQAAGYPLDADADLVEDFFVELRDAIRNGAVKKEDRNHNTDWFSLIQQ